MVTVVVDIHVERTARLNYREYHSPEFAHGCIETMWSFRPEKLARYLVLPDGRVDLLARFHVGPNDAVSHIRLIVAGPAMRSSLVPAAPHNGFLGVRFRPAWGAICLGLNPQMLRDVTLLHEEVYAALGRLAIPLVQAKNTGELRQNLLNTACTLASGILLDSRFARTAKAISLLQARDGKCSVEALAQEAGVSVRTLHRDIVAMTGLSAKSLGTLFRFQRAMRILRLAPSHNLAMLAAEAGYSDQSHMTRDFLRFGGFTPAFRPDVAVINVPRA